MKVYERIRWCHMDPPLQEGDVLIGCNLCQLAPGTEICAAVRDLTFRDCNCVNVKPQPTWTIEGGNWSQTEYCSHERPELIAKGLAKCAEDCKHRVGSEKHWVDIDEKEYREITASLDPKKLPVQVVKVNDAAGVTQQTFQKSAYVYKNAVVAGGSATLKKAGIDPSASLAGDGR